MPTARSGGGPGRRGHRRSGTGGHDAPVPGSVADDTPDADPASVARTIALRKLTAAPRTRAQLADALARGGVPDDVTEVTLDRFEELGLVDDEEFARQWARTRQAGRGLARRALSAELRAKGVDPEVAAEAVEAVDDDDEREAARRLVARKVGAMRRLDRATASRRLMGMLARKGYNGGLAAAVVREALDSADD